MAVGDAYVFPGFLTPVLTQLFFPKPPTTFLTCICRGKKRKYAGYALHSPQFYDWCLSVPRLVSVSSTIGVCQFYDWCLSVLRLVPVSSTIGACQFYDWCLSVLRLVSVSSSIGVCQFYDWCLSVLRLVSVSSTIGACQFYDWCLSVLRLVSVSSTIGVCPMPFNPFLHIYSLLTYWRTKL